MNRIARISLARDEGKVKMIAQCGASRAVWDVKMLERFVRETYGIGNRELQRETSVKPMTHR